MEVDAIRGGRVGNYRVAAFPSAARTLVSDAWSAIRADQAGVELTLTTPEPETALALLVAGETDLALVHSYSNVPRDLPNGVEAELLATEPIWLAIRSDDPHAGDEVDLADLARYPWITPERNLTCFEMTDRACGLAGFRPAIVAETVDFAAQLELVRAGAGVALVPQLTVAALPPEVMLARPRQRLNGTSPQPDVARCTLTRDSIRSFARSAGPPTPDSGSTRPDRSSRQPASALVSLRWWVTFPHRDTADLADLRCVVAVA
jgi:DNA-binding transcriptional LysR family regulator